VSKNSNRYTKVVPLERQKVDFIELEV